MRGLADAGQVQYAVVGEENRANLRLYEILGGAFGRATVRRFLELRHLQEYLPEASTKPLVICLDLFCYEPTAVAESMEDIRDRYPKAVFALYVDRDEYEHRRRELPGNWPTRITHYYKIFREPDDTGYEPIVRASLRYATEEAIYNMDGEPIRLTPVAHKGVVGGDPEETGLDRTIFLSYSRQDWDEFVEDLVKHVVGRGHKLWLDQEYILGGDDWMDAVGIALQECDTLLLVLSPQAVNSRYVKMEYRYFFRQKKPIIPILCRNVDMVPFELDSLHRLSFVGDWQQQQTPLAQLFRILATRRDEREE